MASIDLTTLAAVKTFLGITTATSDAVLAQLITAASQFAATYCSTVFEQATRTETYDGTGTNLRMLRYTPVTNVAAVTVSGKAWPLSSSDTMGGYQWDEKTLYATGCWAFPWRRRAVVVTYTAGYVLPAGAPPDLAQAVIEMVADKYTRRDKMGVSSRIIANETIVYAAHELPRSARGVLDSYKKVAPV